MARIETYGRDTVVTGLDKVLGTDRESGKATKNYEMSAIKAYILDGADPSAGGQMKITSVIQDQPINNIETPAELLNDLDPSLEIGSYEVLIVSLTFNDLANDSALTTNVYMFNKVDVTVGYEEYVSTMNDFILLSSKVEGSETDYSQIISNVGSGSINIYKGFNTTTNSNEMKTIMESNSGSQFLYEDSSSPSDIKQRGLNSSDLNVVSTDDEVQLNTSSINENLGGETAIYKGYTNNKHQFKTIKSSDSSVSITSSADTIDLTVVESTPNEPIERDFYITGDGQTNPLVFNSDFEGGLIATTRTLIKEVNGFKYYRVEVKGQLKMPLSLGGFPNIIIDMPSDYKPLLGSLVESAPVIIVGGVSYDNSANTQDYVGYNVELNNFELYSTYQGSANSAQGYISLDYYSSNRPYPTYDPTGSNLSIEITQADCSTTIDGSLTYQQVYSSNDNVIPSGNLYQYNVSAGDVLYSDSGRTTPFNGNNEQYFIFATATDGTPVIQNFVVRYQVSSAGVVSNIVDCTLP